MTHKETNTDNRQPWKVLILPALILVLVTLPALRGRTEAETAPATVTAPPVAKPVVIKAVPIVTEAEAPVFPVASHQVSDVISRFGESRDGGRRSHLGIDIAAPRGTNVLAVADGSIERVDNEKLGGRVVWLREKRTKRLHYFAHLQTVAVTRGQTVNAGQPIGTVGTTGNAVGTQPHLHYAVRVKGNHLDPITLFRTSGTASAGENGARVMRTTVGGAALKATPGGQTIAVLPTNEPVSVKGESGRFYRVRYRGKEGYVARWLLTSS